MAGGANIPILPFFEGHRGETLEERFWSMVEIGDQQDCWDWKASRTRGGYGRFKARPTTTLHTNRVAWSLHHRRDPGELIIRHTCDRPPCCNPFHLEIGTHADNAADKMERGRHRSGNHSGERNPRAKLTEADVSVIVTALQAGLNNKQIAARVPVGHALISRIRVGQAWAKQSRALGWEPKPQFARLTHGVSTHG